MRFIDRGYCWILRAGVNLKRLLTLAAAMHFPETAALSIIFSSPRQGDSWYRLGNHADYMD
jgi:hypothetical protein